MPHKVAGARTCGDQYLDQTQSFVQKDPKFLGVLYSLCPLILGFCTNWGEGGTIFGPKRTLRTLVRC
jgi:hypothetical protein